MAVARCIAATKCGKSSTATRRRLRRAIRRSVRPSLPWVEITVSSGSNGNPPPPPPAPLLKEGDIATVFYNVAKGDAPYFKELADTYTLADYYHQPVMGGTFANSMVLGYADALGGLDDEQERKSDIGGLPRRAGSKQSAHQNAEIVARDMNEISFMDVFTAAQPRAAHAAALQDMGEAAFDDLAAFADGFLADARLQPITVPIDRLARLVVAMPA